MTIPRPTTTTLGEGRTILLLPTLAAICGLNEALVLQQLQYRLRTDPQAFERDGGRWIGETHEAWRVHFQFLGVDTIRKTFAGLTARGIVVGRQFGRPAGLTTYSYTIDWDVLTRTLRDAATDHPALAGALATGWFPRPTQALLIDEPPVPVNVNAAANSTLVGTLLLQQVHYWTADERRQPEYDNARYVSPDASPLLDPLGSWDCRYLKRQLRELVADGMLIERTLRLGGPLDQRRSYRIDYAAWAARNSTPIAQDIAADAPILQTPMATQSPVPGDTASPADATVRTAPMRTPDDVATPQSPSPLTGTETPPQTPSQTPTYPEQQQHANDTSRDVVTPVPPSGIELAAALRERGISDPVARHLADAYPERIVRHLDVYDWLGSERPADPHHTPGQLRRMIEEDWSPPTGYRPPAARRAARAAADVAARDEEARREQMRQEDARRLEERMAHLARFGLKESDQAIWHILTADHETPAYIRNALFRPPSEGTNEPALVIVASDVERQRAENNGALRKRLCQKIAQRYRRQGVAITVIDEEQLLELLSNSSPIAAAGTTEIPASSAAAERRGSGDGDEPASFGGNGVDHLQAGRCAPTKVSPSGVPLNVPPVRHAPGASNIIKFPPPATGGRKP